VIKIEKIGVTAILIFSVVAFGGALLLPEEPKQESKHKQAQTPWNISISPNGNSQVLGVTLNQTTLNEAEKIWREEAEITLFLKSEDIEVGRVEAYFARTAPAGVRGKIVVEVRLTKGKLQHLIDSGSRISTQGDGSRKVALDDEGTKLVGESPITTITYLPRSDLSEQTIVSRFGKPAEIISIQEGITHWLYPNLGLDIAIAEDGGEVLQYISPKDMQRLITPLRTSPATLTKEYDKIAD
jgi:hypothetical protein